MEEYSVDVNGGEILISNVGAMAKAPGGPPPSRFGSFPDLLLKV